MDRNNIELRVLDILRSDMSNNGISDQELAEYISNSSTEDMLKFLEEYEEV